MRNRIEKDWSRQIKCSNLIKNLNEKNSKTTSIRSSIIIFYKIIIFFSVIIFAEEFNSFI